jgi:hypothetical protein
MRFQGGVKVAGCAAFLRRLQACSHNVKYQDFYANLYFLLSRWLFYSLRVH